MHRLWLLRHARPLVDPGVCYGRLDVAADAEDTQRSATNFSAALAAQAAKDFSATAMLRHSPSQRCEQLVHALIGLQPDLAQNSGADARLQEMDFGAWEGLAWDGIARSEIDAWAANLAGHAPGGGEPLATMLKRVQSALQHSWTSDSQSGLRDVVWVTHAGVIRCVQWLLQRGHQPPCSADWNLPAPGFGQWLELSWPEIAPALHP